jgi:hypothetical protein
VLRGLAETGDASAPLLKAGGSDPYNGLFEIPRGAMEQAIEALLKSARQEKQELTAQLLGASPTRYRC